ncbi:PLP-dependent transferase [Rhizodiscina lignyota]|uniref:PLP-dependent transferase n=1 Tax=Rhizodiscina lignyota TaxID=1504668 RepID=A0A9P4IPU9_9PEZI|nr:PLP-dependent transferase [Rhizodiscina lignyota]
MALPPSKKIPLVNDGNVVISTNGTESTHSAVLHRNLHHAPKTVVSAEGIYITLSNGQKILDATGGAAVSCLGHGNKRVKEALQKQMDEISYCHSLFFSVNAAERLGEELCKGTDGKMARAWICSSGSEAMEAALKLSRQYWLESVPPQPQRVRFIARRESYHGITLGALGVSGHVTRRALYEPLLNKNISHVSPCNAYRGMKDGETEAQYVERLAKELDDELQRVGPDTVCAFIAEPVVGAVTGCVPAVPGYFKAMKAICDKYGVLMIMDEIMSGMGRSGTLHAWEQEGIVPDIETIGKGLGGGYAPVAGILINPRVVDVLSKGTGAFSHGQTYQGHPIACAAAAEVQAIVREQNLVQNCKEMGVHLEKGLKSRLSDHPNVGNIRGKGLFWGVEFVKDKVTKEPFDPKDAIAMGVHEKGIEPPFNISLYPGTGVADGRAGDVAIIAPAYNVTKEEIELVVDLTARVIEEFFKEV